MKRVQFEMPERQHEELQKLMKEVGIRTKTELLNNALTLLQWSVDVRKQGRIVVSIDEKAGRYQELLMPFFNRVKKTESEQT